MADRQQNSAKLPPEQEINQLLSQITLSEDSESESAKRSWVPIPAIGKTGVYVLALFLALLRGFELKVIEGWETKPSQQEERLGRLALFIKLIRDKKDLTDLSVGESSASARAFMHSSSMQEEGKETDESPKYKPLAKTLRGILRKCLEIVILNKLGAKRKPAYRRALNQLLVLFIGNSSCPHTKKVVRLAASTIFQLLDRESSYEYLVAQCRRYDCMPSFAPWKLRKFRVDLYDQAFVEKYTGVKLDRESPATPATLEAFASNKWDDKTIQLVLQALEISKELKNLQYAATKRFVAAKKLGCVGKPDHAKIDSELDTSLSFDTLSKSNLGKSEEFSAGLSAVKQKYQKQLRSELKAKKAERAKQKAKASKKPSKKKEGAPPGSAAKQQRPKKRTQRSPASPGDPPDKRVKA